VTHCRGQALPRTVPLEVLPRGGTHHALEVVTLGLRLGTVQTPPLGLQAHRQVLGRTPLRAAAALARDPALALALIGERPPARLAQRRYFDDPDVQGIEGPVPPLGPARDGGELKPLVLPRHAAPTQQQQAQSQEGEPERDLSGATSDSEGAEAALAAAPASGPVHDADDLPQPESNPPLDH